MVELSRFYYSQSFNPEYLLKDYLFTHGLLDLMQNHEVRACGSPRSPRCGSRNRPSQVRSACLVLKFSLDIIT